MALLEDNNHGMERVLTGKEIVLLAQRGSVAVAKRAEMALLQFDPDGLIKCHEECSLCCNLQVGVRPFEVIGIAGFLNSTMSTERFQEVRYRIRSTASHYFDEGGRRDLFVSCPLLDNRRCLVYPVRPAACSAHMSYDLRLCDPMSANGTVISHPFIQSIIWNFADAYELIFGFDTKTSPDWLEFVIALDAIVDEPEAQVAKWAVGQDIFEKARVRKGI